MPADQIIGDLINQLPSRLFNLLSIILLVMHFLFALVVVRQTKLMLKVVEAQISAAIYAVSIIHLLVSLFVLLWAILFL